MLMITGIVILALFIGLLYKIFLTGPTLPENTNALVDSLIETKIPEFVTGDAGFVKSGENRVWYESITPDDSVKGTVILFMGISNDALGWPQKFIDNLVASGYRVIRYDYRGTGMSGSVENDPYTLKDLAADAVLILDTLHIEKAHLVGVSLGGMVAQEYAIHFPERASTLTSVMSSGNIVDPELPAISKKFVIELVSSSLKYSLFSSEKNVVKRNIAVRVILQGDADYDIDVTGVAQQVLYNLRERNGYNRKASKQQQQAVMNSGSRYEELKSIDIPTLVIHGVNDPFIPIAHSKKLASVIPGARTLWVDNMGHDVPPYLIDSLTDILTEHFEGR